MNNNFNKSYIRNFAILSHIDHGKSTLADRFLELTETIPKEKMHPQYLDLMDLEREKGITIKMQPVRMNYTLKAITYTLNLIDTPGHVDFSYEVSRSLAAVEGAILLVDATKGIQAQTLANLELAKRQNLVIIPVINKIDLFTPYRAEDPGRGSQARIEEVKKEITQILNIEKEEIISISAKYGTNVKKVLIEAVIKKIPPPKGNLEQPLRALIFDAKYNPYQGVIAYVRVMDGKIEKDQKIYLIAGKTQSQIQKVGFFKPELCPADELKAGEIGYIATGIKEPSKVRVGDTITSVKFKMQNEKLEVEPLPGYQVPQPMVFLSISPQNPDDFEFLEKSLGKFRLNDSALIFKPERKEGLGRGFQAGFLGLLHAEIVIERLKREFGINLILSTPSVIYKILTWQNEEILIYTPSDWPDLAKIKEIREPWTKIQVLAPLDYLGQILEMIKKLKVEHLQTDYLGKEKIEIICELPLREIIIKNFYDELKNISQGFASMNYEILDFRTSDLVKLDILIAGKKQEPFSKIVPKEKALLEGRKIVRKLKEILPPQLFPMALQAASGGKIIARETLSAKRKNVIAPLYGGDFTRKRKLLEKQKRGKKKLREKGQFRLHPKVFLEILKSKI